MNDKEEIKINDAIVKYLIRKILTKENEAIRKGTDSRMPNEIREWIKEAVNAAQINKTE